MNRYVITAAAALLVAGTAHAGQAPRAERDAPSAQTSPLTVAGSERSRRVVAREVCEDVEVTERRERDGNVGGTVAGAVIGGLLGNQVGSGSGRKAATVAGAVAGGVAGNRIDRNHDGGKRRTHVERECRTVYEEPRYR
ncbi:uncharacterized protein YcfJ [Chiayiivirga flava]|uniref:Uncharacterized protein YcfJ n=1 Tax=Chiayiivirga flava TaxID=659595 RepID=A0A7W8FXR3_9GAMM|nr:uncharacterized protein YcfJ [Chiayiivirga flava]